MTHARSLPAGPNFFVVGAPKCGTTALYTYLKQHPDVFLPAVKEPGYFASDFHFRQRRRPTLESYLALYAGVRGERHVGDTSTRYFVSRRAPTAIREFDRRARIIVMLRNPIELMHSLHSQLVYQGDERVDDFAAALSVEEERRALVASSEPAPILHFLVYRDVARYGEHVERYFDAFGRERVHVILFEDFARDTPTAYRQVLEFLEADPHFEPSFDVVNQYKAVRTRWLHTFLLRPPRPVQMLARAVVPVRLRRAIFSKARALNTRFEQRPEISVDLREQLEAEFAGEIDRLEELLDRDLSVWRADPTRTPA